MRQNCRRATSGGPSTRRMPLVVLVMPGLRGIARNINELRNILGVDDGRRHENAFGVMMIVVLVVPRVVLLLQHTMVMVVGMVVLAILIGWQLHWWRWWRHERILLLLLLLLLLLALFLQDGL